LRPKTTHHAHFSRIKIGKVRPSDLNPRRHFDPDQLAELADSFSEHGIIQPIIVYKKILIMSSYVVKDAGVQLR